MMAKFNAGDKVRLKKGLKVGQFYGGVPLLYDMKELIEANGGVCKVRKVHKFESGTLYTLDMKYTYYYYSGEMIEFAEDKEEKTKKDFLETLTLMIERITKRLNEIMKSNEEE